MGNCIHKIQRLRNLYIELYYSETPEIEKSTSQFDFDDQFIHHDHPDFKPRKYVDDNVQKKVVFIDDSIIFDTNQPVKQIYTFDTMIDIDNIQVPQDSVYSSYFSSCQVPDKMTEIPHSYSIEYFDLEN